MDKNPIDKNTSLVNKPEMMYRKSTRASRKMFYNRRVNELLDQSRYLAQALKKLNKSLNEKNLSKSKRAVSTSRSNLTGFKNLGKVLLVLGGATLLSRGIAEYLDN